MARTNAILATLKGAKARIAADPGNPEVYVAAALEDDKRSRDPAWPAEMRKLLAERADRWLDAARKVDRSSPMVTFHRGLIRHRRGEPGALKLLYRGVRNGHRTPESVDTLAHVAGDSRSRLARKARRLIKRLRRRYKLRSRAPEPR